MTRDEFLTEMQDVLQTEETLSFETVLEELAKVSWRNHTLCGPTG